LASGQVRPISGPVGSGQTTPLPLIEEPAQSRTYSLKARIGKTVAEEEKKLIGEVLTKTNWNRRKAAELLEISYRSLLYKIKDYKLDAAK
jgi:transcriptional regulator with PAS, ATPase and Fis domain